MLDAQTIKLSPYYLGVTVICIVVAAIIYLRFGFGYRHWNLPPVESVILSVLGVFLAASGLKVIYSLFVAAPLTADLIIPLVVTAIILVHMGIKDVLKAFRTADSKPQHPPKKEDVD